MKSKNWALVLVLSLGLAPGAFAAPKKKPSATELSKAKADVQTILKGKTTVTALSSNALVAGKMKDNYKASPTANQQQRTCQGQQDALQADAMACLDTCGQAPYAEGSPAKKFIDDPLAGLAACGALTSGACAEKVANDQVAWCFYNTCSAKFILVSNKAAECKAIKDTAAANCATLSAQLAQKNTQLTNSNKYVGEKTAEMGDKQKALSDANANVVKKENELKAAQDALKTAQTAVKIVEAFIKAAQDDLAAQKANSTRLTNEIAAITASMKQNSCQ